MLRELKVSYIALFSKDGLGTSEIRESDEDHRNYLYMAHVWPVIHRSPGKVHVHIAYRIDKITHW